MEKTKQFKILLLSGIILVMMVGCTPSEIIAPVVDPESEKLIMYILIILVGYLLWNVYQNKIGMKESHTENHLKHIDSRLNIIEQDIQNIKSKLEGKDHDKK